MRLWIFIMLAAAVIAAISALYVGIRLPRLFNIEPDRKVAVIGVCAVLAAMAAISFFLSVADAAACVFYVAAAWLACDALACLPHVPLGRFLSAWTAVVVSLAALACGWQNVHGLARTHLPLASEKIRKPFRIAFFADAHVGTIFDAEGFAKRLEKVREEKPDVVAVVGDLVDDDTSREDVNHPALSSLNGASPVKGEGRGSQTAMLSGQAPTASPSGQVHLEFWAD